MKAIVINKFGIAEDVFETVELPVPVPGDNEIVVKVKATSVNPFDTVLRMGYIPQMIRSFPAILHGDIAGEVESVGDNVASFKKGDQIYAWSGGFSGKGGALAEYVKIDYRIAALKSPGINFGHAAASALVGLTAYDALIVRADIKPGQKVLIYGAAGGVGHMALQIAKIAGADVYAVIGNAAQAETAISLGANHVINYNDEKVEDYKNKYTKGFGFDVVFDTVGNDNLPTSFQAVRPLGTLVTTVAMVNIDLSPLHMKGINFHVVFLALALALNDINMLESWGRNLAQITEWVNDGKINVLTDSKKFTLENVAEAHRLLESKKNSGKVVITV
jgi:NADPH2:quinone reductase